MSDECILLLLFYGELQPHKSAFFCNSQHAVWKGRVGGGCALFSHGHTNWERPLICPPTPQQGYKVLNTDVLIMENIQYCSHSYSPTPPVSFSSCCHLISDLSRPLEICNITVFSVLVIMRRFLCLLVFFVPCFLRLGVVF